MNALPASWVLIPCPDCDGEGYSEQAVPGGYFDLSQECWYPSEKVIECQTCLGEGHIEVMYDLEPIVFEETYLQDPGLDTYLEEQPEETYTQWLEAA